MYKSSPFLLSLALIVGCGAQVEGLDRAALGVNEDEPILDLTERAIFFDQVCEGDETTRVLGISNFGGSPLVVTALRLSGTGYSLLNRPGLPRVLPAGGHLALVLRYSPNEARLAPYDGALRVVSNDVFEPVLDVPLHGLSLPGTLRVTPRQHDFGSIEDGGSRVFTIALRALDGCPAYIDRARATGILASALRWGAVPDRVGAGEVKTLQVRARCNGEDDTLEALLRFSDRDGMSIGSAQFLGYCER